MLTVRKILERLGLKEVEGKVCRDYVAFHGCDDDACVAAIVYECFRRNGYISKEEVAKRFNVSVESLEHWHFVIYGIVKLERLINGIDEDLTCAKRYVEILRSVANSKFGLKHKQIKARVGRETRREVRRLLSSGFLNFDRVSKRYSLSEKGKLVLRILNERESRNI